MRAGREHPTASSTPDDPLDALRAERDRLAAAVDSLQPLCTVLPPDPGGDADTATAHTAGWNAALPAPTTEETTR